MKIRDSMSVINGGKDAFVADSGCIDIIANDGRTLYSIRLIDDLKIEVRASDVIKHLGKLYAERLTIEPVVSNSIKIGRSLYE